ncbi:MAG: arginyltransferase [Chromatiales bacterium]|nr:arginyltransferase [Chromatiales bacterium]
MRKELAFFAIPEQSCTYLPERAAGMLFVDPRADIDTGVYSYLIQHGFRRSGDYVYRPKCPNCDACVPIRLPVRDFLPRRSQRRNWKANHGLRVQSRKAEFNDEHYALYERYVKGRHRGGGMDDTSPDQYVDFLANQWGDTRFYEFREGNRLLAVAVVDHLINALSAVYTFFDPDYRDRGLGVYSILWQIEESRRLGNEWLYLGYWIRECRKMAYKDEYRPLEVYRSNRWIRYGPGEEVDTRQDRLRALNVRLNPYEACRT